MDKFSIALVSARLVDVLNLYSSAVVPRCSPFFLVAPSSNACLCKHATARCSVNYMKNDVPGMQSMLPCCSIFKCTRNCERGILPYSNTEVKCSCSQPALPRLEGCNHNRDTTW
ncbi:hypothetical protein C0J52_04925 [Blattella germanica]|nr:hypothetical protein C0J52_04925 [Blattella germanica]